MEQLKVAPRLPAANARDVLAHLVKPALHVQRWSLDAAPVGALSRVVHLHAGRGIVSHERGELSLRAPDVAWLPAGSARALEVEAGSAGVTVGVSDSLLAAAMGAHADAAPLRQVSVRACVVGEANPAARDELVRSLHAIEAEARRPAGGSRTYLAAHLALILVNLWRLTSRDTAEPHPSHAPDRADLHRLQRFRHLVEAQFRDHWTIARYAQELSISPDRLHDQCVSTLGRAPLALVHQRVVREACALLAGTDLSIERLASDLGFGGASHFSRFFKRWMSLGPQAWRRQARLQAAVGQARLPTSYADWP